MKYLYLFFVKPLEYIIEIFFTFFYRSLGNAGISLFFLSIIVSLMALPLYIRADEIQKAEKEKQRTMRKWLDHIKRTFSREEKFYMRQVYYREQDYKPYQVLNGSLSLLIQIPIFTAAYHYLSNLEVLNESSFWIISNLGKPDALLKIFGISINLLPLLMTLINFIASAIFSRNEKWSEKWQMYVLAVIFLVILYDSPSGLVLYWTCNNLFSLIKNLVYVLNEKKPAFAKYINMISLGLPAVCLMIIFIKYNFTAYPVETMYLGGFILSQIPLMILIFKDRKKNEYTTDKRIYILEQCIMSILIGVLIPVTTIASSPSEFIRAGIVNDPLQYVADSFFTASGMFILWGTVVYRMLKERGRYYFEFLLFVTIVLFVSHYFFLGKDFGMLTSDLQMSGAMIFEDLTYEISTMILFAVPLITYYLWKKNKKIITFTCMFFAASFILISLRYCSVTEKEVKELGSQEDSETEKVEISLSRNGKNVIVFMLDRAISGYLPYMLEERPELAEKLDGFTYYPNTLSFAWHTNIGSQPLFGGYEYTPERLNERTDKTMKEKQTESLLLMPVLFSKNGYEVTVCDPPYAGYEEWGDLSIYEDYPDIKAMHLAGNNSKMIGSEKSAFLLDRNFFVYSIMRCVPVFFREMVYDEGRYWSLNRIYNTPFARSYQILSDLERITYFNDSEKGSFLAIDNETTHNSAILKQPEYIPSDDVTGNKYYVQKHFHRFIEDPNYHTNMASVLRLAEWFEFLKEAGVWDNTRVIIVSDHGYPNGDFPEMIYGGGLDAEAFNPLFLVKDFGAKGFNISNDLMTNADTPYFALRDLEGMEKNPFTGKKIDMEDKYNKEGQLVLDSANYMPVSGYSIDKSEGSWYRVKDDVFDKGNWVRIYP